MRELDKTRVFVTGYHHYTHEALTEARNWLLDVEENLTVVGLDLDMTEEADYYVTVVVE